MKTPMPLERQGISNNDFESTPRTVIPTGSICKFSNVEFILSGDATITETVWEEVTSDLEGNAVVSGQYRLEDGSLINVLKMAGE